ncbi:AbrB family transcriptional regulator [Planococcus salinus]|uniref:AbrB family transcriptional regulator n=1 Tax=Planococcus salinus TaxID=1848460 RepID=A0A3M8PCU0_9BACL|nr:AbrB family transcriptional regulator [Planococcus salinus]RNF40920.1 AbrB family transcriptional regulator [Planococcus salinus]
MYILLRTALIAVSAGFLFERLGMFLPWLLGPLLALLLLNQFTSLEFRWPNTLRIIGLLVLGMQMGSSFTRDSVLLMWVDLPYMAFMSVAVVTMALLLGFLFRKMANESLATSLLGSMPGGLSQMVLISEEVKTANMTVVSMMQTIRIFLVVTTIPFFTTFLSGRSASEIEETFFSFSPLHFGVAFVLGAAIYAGMKRVHFPAAEMLAPILVLAIVQTFTGEQLVNLPPLLINGAQVLVGAHLGLQMQDLREKLNVRLASAILVNNFLLIGFTAILAYILVNWLPAYLFLDFFLSAAPGGMAEMTITALETGGDVALITSFQLFRLFFVLLIAAPAVAYIVKKLDAKTAN